VQPGVPGEASKREGGPCDDAQQPGGVWSRWQLYEHVRLGLLPHVKLPGRRELLFPVVELERYEAGECELETVRLPKGGRLCRPRRR
jgi:hypothetical protein